MYIEFSFNFVIPSEDKYGLIDHFGKILVPVKYDDIRGFQGEYTRVCFEDKWGIINIYGEEIISPKYDWIGEDNGISIAIFSEGITIFIFSTNQSQILFKAMGKTITGFDDYVSILICKPIFGRTIIGVYRIFF